MKLKELIKIEIKSFTITSSKQKAKQRTSQLNILEQELKRLQDIELSIRALLLGTNYQVIDNKVDFFYCVAPIDIKKRPVKEFGPMC